MKPAFNREFKPPSSWEGLHFGSSNDVGVLTSVNSGFRVYVPKYEKENCSLCMLCWVFCPEGCIDKTGEALTIDLDYCKGCGICSAECPKGCIGMVKE